MYPPPPPPPKEKCNLDCCEDEWKIYQEVERMRIPPPPADQIIDISEPIKVFLFDTPIKAYKMKTRAGAVLNLANVVLGCVCVMVFMYAYTGGPYCGDKYSRLSKKLHLPLQAVAILFHGSIGVMALSEYYDSSHVLRWKERRTQHVRQMSYSIMFMTIELILFWVCHDYSEMEYDTSVKPCPCDDRDGYCVCPTCDLSKHLKKPHFIVGVLTILCYAFAAVTGLFLYVFMKPGPKGRRGEDHILGDIHSLVGILGYMFGIATVGSGLHYEKYKIWFKYNFKEPLFYLLEILLAYLFFSALIGPVSRLFLRFKDYKAMLTFRREQEERILMEEIELMRCKKEKRELHQATKLANEKKKRKKNKRRKIGRKTSF